MDDTLYIFLGLIVIVPAAGSTRKGELIEPLLHSEGKEGGVVLVMEYIGLSETTILKLNYSSCYKGMCP